MAHWTDVLTNVSLVEFVLLAVLTAAQWIRHRIRGAGWIALSFVIVGGLALAVRIHPAVLSNQDAAKAMLAVLVLMPYCLFRFVASLRTPSLVVRILAAAVTVGVVAFTLTLRDVPARGAPVPPHLTAYQACLLVAFGLLFGYVVMRLLAAGRVEPPIAAWRMRLLAAGVTGLALPVVVAALRLHGQPLDLITRSVTVASGLLLLVSLVVPSIVRLPFGRREDLAFRRAVEELVSAGTSEDVANHLLPHLCALVGAFEAALVAADGTVVARHPLWLEGERPDVWADDRAGEARSGRVTVRATSGAAHSLVVKIGSSMPYFGTEELRKLDQLAGMVGLAIERCEMAEQVAFQASHDVLTGLANRSLFVERLDEALRHVGRRRAAIAVLFIDLDRFKLVNDRADHGAGDRVLNEMASRLVAMTRGVDVVARFGGDEFVVVAEVEHESDALDMAQRIRRGIAAPVEVGDQPLVVTASIGVVVTADPTATPATLLHDADDAMYEAKRSGRDQVVVHHERARRTADARWGLTGAGRPRLNAG